MSPARVELHCHLDGSVRPATIEALARDQGLTLPGRVEDLAVAPRTPVGLMPYIARIDVALRVLQTAPALERAARELVEDWHEDGVAHGEVRFAPALHTRAGLTPREAVEAVTRGLGDGTDATSVTTGLLLCVLRHDDPADALATARLAVDMAGVVAGLDLAGDERLPGHRFERAFALAGDAGLGVTVHAGEAAGPASVREALDVLGARRIGHGVRSVADQELVRRLAAERVVLETCPISNYQTGAVPSAERHPARTLLTAGVPVTVSTDARTVSGTSLSAEFAWLRRTVGLTADEEATLLAHAVDGAFVSEARRRRLRAA